MTNAMLEYLLGTSYKNPLHLPTFLCNFNMKHRQAFKRQIVGLIESGAVGYFRTSAIFKQNPRNGAMWRRCKNGSRRCKEIDSLYIEYDGYVVSQVFLKTAT
jgi:hypothetical protein